MKRIFAVLLAVFALAAFVGCRADKKQEDEPAIPTEAYDQAKKKDDDESNGPKATAVPRDIKADEVVGPWRLAEDADLGALAEVFPGIAESGSGMEIRSDGNISWFVGDDGAVGTYVIEGYTLKAEVRGDRDGLPVTVTLTMLNDGSLSMSFREAELVWVSSEG